MLSEMKFMPSEQILSVKVTGVITYNEWEDILRGLIRESARWACFRYLIDYRSAELRLSLIDLYKRPETYQMYGLDTRVRIGVTFPAGFTEGKFYELISLSRGYQVKVFDSTDPAIRWLTADRSRQSVAL